MAMKFQPQRTDAKPTIGAKADQRKKKKKKRKKKRSSYSSRSW